MMDYEAYRALQDKKAAERKAILVGALTPAAVELLAGMTEHEEAGSACWVVFENKETSPELRKAVVERLLELRPLDKKGHGLWVHTLSNCDQPMWEAGAIEEIKMLYREAFEKGRMHGTAHCLNRLVSRLVGKYAVPQALGLDPLDFGLTPEVKEWVAARSLY